MNIMTTTTASSHRQKEMGLRLRALRTGRKLSIGELAAGAGVSTGVISQIERGKANPSLKTLELLRQALGVTLWSLLEPEPLHSSADPAFVRRAADRVKMTVGKGRLEKELLSPNSEQDLRFMIITVPPGSASEDVMVGGGEKGGLVLEGQLDLIVGDERATLSEGDSFQFGSEHAHQIANPNDEAAKVLWIMRVNSVQL